MNNINNLSISKIKSNLSTLDNEFNLYEYQNKLIIKKINFNNKEIRKQIKIENELRNVKKSNSIFKVLKIIEDEDELYILYDKNGFINLEEFLLNHKITKSGKLSIFYQILKTIINLQDLFFNLNIKIENIFINNNYEIKIFLNEFEFDNKTKNNSFELEDNEFEIDDFDITENIPNDYKDDIVNLGIILYFIFHDKNPFKNLEEDEIIDILYEQNFEVKDKLKNEIKILIYKLLEFRSSNRPNLKEIINNKLFDKFKIKKNNFLDIPKLNNNLPGSMINLDLNLDSSSKQNHSCTNIF